MTHEGLSPEIRTLNRQLYVNNMREDASMLFGVFYGIYTHLPPTTPEEFARATTYMLSMFHYERMATMLSTLLTFTDAHHLPQTLSLEWSEIFDEQDPAYETISNVALEHITPDEYLLLHQEAVNATIELMGEWVIGRKTIARPTPELTGLINATRRNKHRHTITGLHDMDLVYDYDATTQPKNTQGVKVSIKLKKIKR